MADWRLATSLVALRRETDALWPQRDKASDGTIGDVAHAGRPSDHNPDSNGVVRAWDVTSWDGPDGDVAQLVVDHVTATRDPRVSYVIWRRRIVNSRPIGDAPPWTWRPYDGANPHARHAHISVRTPPQGDDASPWNLEEVIMPSAQEIAAALLTSKIRRAWDGQEVSVAALLSGVHYYAVSGAMVGEIPTTATSRPGQPTAFAQLLAAARQAPPPIDVDELATALAAKLPAVSGDVVERAIREVLGGLDAPPGAGG